MLNGIVKITANLWGQLFPERQIYLRSNGRVRYVTLSPLRQFTFGSVFLLAFGWTSFTSINSSLHWQALSARETRLNELQTDYDRLSKELAEIQLRFAALAQSEKQSDQPPLSLPAANLSSGNSEAPGEEALTVAEKPIGDAGMLPRPRPGMRLTDAGAAPNTILPRARPARPAFTLPAAMTALESKAYDQGHAFGSGLTGGGTFNQSTSQNDVIGFLASDASTAIPALEKLISLTGLDADTMLRRQNAATGTAEQGHGEGGPLLKAPPPMQGKLLRRNIPDQLDQLSTRKGRLELLREALFSLPLALPVDKYYVSSGFGYRRDPFTRDKAFHSGMDMVSAHGDPVRSSAPGTVIFAGRNGPYGNMVEIDHGRGVKSRYGHLSKISVVRGQKIGLRDLIGLVGNTGRSGTAHLHFEVWFDGKPRDPRNFLKAGENVFQRQG